MLPIPALCQFLTSLSCSFSFFPSFLPCLSPVQEEVWQVYSYPFSQGFTVGIWSCDFWSLLQETLQNSNRPLKIPAALPIPGKLKETAAYAATSSHQEAGFGRRVHSMAPLMPACKWLHVAGVEEGSTFMVLGGPPLGAARLPGTGHSSCQWTGWRTHYRFYSQTRSFKPVLVTSVGNY